ncbi:MAG: asparagine synthetase B [Cytophagaceae bacterium]|nr:asparagine synthetase B [Cytophagaceae bacterium]
MTTRQRYFTFLLVLLSIQSQARSILIPMDDKQTNHLKAYGIAYSVLKDENEVDWLLNYRGGSFLIKHTQATENECRVRGVYFEMLTDATTASVLQQIEAPDINMSAVKLVKAAKIVVYSPVKVSPAEFENTDAVLLVLTYAEIPYEIVYDEEILRGDLAKYDWLHLHHEDFTGQFGRNTRRMSVVDVKAQEAIARKFNFPKVSQMKLAVAKAIKAFCAGGRYLFAMCSAAETFDVALAADGVDIVESTYDGDGIDPAAQSKLDFSKTVAFENFTIDLDGGYRGMTFSDINAEGGGWGSDGPNSYFSLFQFSAKWDVIPTMLTQNHESSIREFMGQTNAFQKRTVKSSVLVMGEGKNSHRYLYGELGLGQWTFYGGHDPEGVRGGGGGFGNWRIPTDLNLHPHSPGYRLILNNVLFPSARKKKRKT